MYTYNPSRILHGCDLNRLFAESHINLRLGTHALVVTNAELSRNGTIRLVRDSLAGTGVDSILFDGIDERAASDIVDETASLAAGGRAEYVIGVGPPHILDIARVVCLAAEEGKNVYHFIDSKDTGASRGGLPFAAVPTRCWNPLLFSDMVVVTDARDGAARLIRTGRYPDSAFFFSGLLSNLTGKQVVYDLLCIFLSCIEGMAGAETAQAAGYPLILNAFQDAVSILRAIPTSDTPPDRERIQKAGIHSGWFSPFPGAGFALGTSSHSVAGISAEWVTAALIPEVAALRVAQDSGLLHTMLDLLGMDAAGEDEMDAEAVEREARSLTALADVPRRLRALGFERHRLPDIAAQAAGICDIEQGRLYSLLQAAF